MLAFVVVMAMVVGLIGFRLITVQVVDREQYVAYGESQRDGFRTLPASRGAIYDRNGQAFAMSVAQPRVIADPSQVRHPIKTSRALASILGLDAAEVEADLRADTRYRVIATGISDEQAAAIGEAKGEGDIEGITLDDEYVRSHPNGDLALAVIGNALADGQTDDEGRTGGISGIERAHDGVLAGKPGKYFYEQDVSGNPIAGGDRDLEAAQQGADLYLTLDQSLQYEAERSLAAEVEASGADSAQAVIMRPSTGEILAMASVAVDDDGNAVNTRDNRPVTAVFEPGSVNKMITVAAALEEEIVTPETVFNVPDSLQIYDAEFNDSHPHPPTDLNTAEIFFTSSNIGTIKIAQELGKDNVDQYLRAFGFGETTGLGFPAEEDGIMKSVDEWSGVDIGTMPIGQGISVTALQMLAAYNVVANDGIYVGPKLVGATDIGAGQVPSEPTAGRRVISADTAAKMRAMLAQVVSEGTGNAAAIPGYEAAGKTGTSRIAQGSDGEDGYLDENGNYRYDASFVGMVNGADLSILVTVRDPKTSIYGGDIAAPVFAHLAATALRRYQVPPPAILDAAHHAIPDVSASARELNNELDREDVAGASSGAQG